MNLHIRLVSILRFLWKTKNDPFLEHILLPMQALRGLPLPSNYMKHEDEAFILLCYLCERKEKQNTYDLTDSLLYKLLPNPNYSSVPEHDLPLYMLWQEFQLLPARVSSLSELEHWKIITD